MVLLRRKLNHNEGKEANVKFVKRRKINIRRNWVVIKKVPLLWKEANPKRS